MRISFDIDDLLVAPEFAREPPRWAFLRGTAEGLRSGTRGLFEALRRQGHSVCIYTTSFRPALRIRWWLWVHGITVESVVNGQRHAAIVSGQSFARTPSKYPPAFDIQLHIDDSQGVLMEGRELGFAVLVISPGDEDWVRHVLEGVQDHGA
jgi:hypothetical protein